VLKDVVRCANNIIPKIVQFPVSVKDERKTHIVYIYIYNYTYKYQKILLYDKHKLLRNKT
jgi:hypothetical protein